MEEHEVIRPDHADQNPTAAWIERTVDLLSAHYPHWQMHRGVASLPKSRTVVCVSIPMRVEASGAIRFGAYCPEGLLAKRIAGLGRPDPAFPRDLWPLLLSMILAFRLRELGWRPRVSWPNRIIYNGSVLGAVDWVWSESGLEAFAEVNIAPPHSGREPLSTTLEEAEHHGAFPVEPISVIPSLIQVFCQGLESPWPKELLLHHYRRWCVDLKEGDDIDDSGRLVLTGKAPISPDDWKAQTDG